MYKRFILIIGILLLLGVISCSLVKEKTYNIKIVNIPKNIPTSSFNNIRNNIIEYLTYEPLHTLNSSLLDEIHFQDNKLICKLKKGI
ncbi:MAG: hypothetical protein U9N34_11565, partial [Candidatus Cloacimonadota bacterium]|nr:hypothetical protein [Candidatus Cloacimonadota bacterium]